MIVIALRNDEWPVHAHRSILRPLKAGLRVSRQPGLAKRLRLP